MKHMMFVCSDTEPDTDKADEPDIHEWVAQNDARAGVGRRRAGADVRRHDAPRP